MVEAPIFGRADSDPEREPFEDRRRPGWPGIGALGGGLRSLRNKLSYYSLVLLVGLAVVSILILEINPFGGGPASASPAAQASTSAVQKISGGSASSSGVAPSAGNPAGSGLPPGGSYGGDHGRHAPRYGAGGVGGNVTATTTANSVYSQNE